MTCNTWLKRCKAPILIWFGKRDKSTESLLRAGAIRARLYVLIGDAAHAMYPGPGEGARTSFEDAHQLCNVLGEVFCSPPVTSLEDTVTRFEKIRISRVSRIQAYAAERTYWPEYIPEWAQKLTDAEKAQRSKEYVKWVLQYPECMLRDPESTYWKP